MMDFFYQLILTAHAAGTQISTNVPSIGGAAAATTDPLVTTMSYFKFVLGLVGFLALIMIVIGAVMYTISSGSSSKQSEAKDYVKSAFFGMLLLAGAYFIFKAINPDMTSFSFPTLEKLNLTVSANNLCIQGGNASSTATTTNN